MPVSILIPYGPRNEREERIAGLTIDRWSKSFPDWEIVLGEGGEPFNRSRARNDAASRASGDVFVICDADTTFFRATDLKVVSRIAGTRGWYLPAQYYQTTEEWTESLLAGGSIESSVKYDREYNDQPGGWRICSRSDFETVGGFDEGFRGWGYEDTAFAEAMKVLVSPARRFGAALHLWHPTNRYERQEHPDIGHNRNRFAMYRRPMSQRPDGMKLLLQELGVTK